MSTCGGRTKCCKSQICLECPQHLKIHNTVQSHERESQYLPGWFIWDAELKKVKL